MIKLELTPDIIDKHKNYILNESNIVYDLIDLRYKGIYASKAFVRDLNRDEKKFIAYLIDHVRKLKDPTTCDDSIFLMTPEKLQQELGNIEANHNYVYDECKNDNNDFAIALLNAFGYEKFSHAEVGKPRYIKTKPKRTKVVLSWSAYAFTDALGLETCPYCHMSDIKTTISKKGKSRGDLDHFTTKSKYPYLSMSIYNLIPSCQKCNSRYKHEKDFDYSTHINLYENVMDHKLVRFSYFAKSYEAYIGEKPKDIYIKLKHNRRDRNSKRLNKNCDDLDILTRYKGLSITKSTVSSMLAKKRLFDKNERIAFDLSSLGLDFRKLVLNVDSDETLLNQPYGKFKIDIYDEIMNPTGPHIPSAVLKAHEKSESAS
jgi:hypothetical protein